MDFIFIAHILYTLLSYELLEITSISFSCRNYTKLKLTHKKYKGKKKERKRKSSLILKFYGNIILARDLSSRL